MTFIALKNLISKSELTEAFVNLTIEKMDIFLIGNRITAEQYKELMVMLGKEVN